MSGRMFLDFDISMVCFEKQSAFKLLYFSLIAREKCTEVLQEFRFIYRTWSYVSAIVLGLYIRIKKVVQIRHTLMTSLGDIYENEHRRNSRV